MVTDTNTLAGSAREHMSTLRALVEGVSAEQAQARPAEGEWSLNELLSHLSGNPWIDYPAGLQRALSEELPYIPFEIGVSYSTPEREAMSTSELLDPQERVIAAVEGLRDDELSRRVNAPGLEVTPLGATPHSRHDRLGNARSAPREPLRPAAHPRQLRRRPGAIVSSTARVRATVGEAHSAEHRVSV